MDLSTYGSFRRTTGGVLKNKTKQCVFLFYLSYRETKNSVTEGKVDLRKDSRLLCVVMILLPTGVGFGESS